MDPDQLKRTADQDPQCFKYNIYLVSCWFPKSSYLIQHRKAKFSYLFFKTSKVSKGAKIRNLYNQVLHLTQDTNVKVTNSQLYTTNESQEVRPFPAGDHKAHINRRAQIHNKHKTEQKHKISTKEVPPWIGQ